MKVKLLTHTPNPEKVVAMAAKLCYSPVGVEQLEEKLTDEQISKFVNNLVSIGHESPLEHISFTFAIEGISRSCYDDKTEIYTDQGWKYFKDLNQNEKVMTRNKNGGIEFHKPNEYIQYDFDGNMHKYKSQNVDLLVTPNHNMLIKKYDVRKPNYDYELVPSEEINVKRFYMTKQIDDCRDTIEYINIPEYSYMKKYKNNKIEKRTLPELNLDSREFIKLLAWYLAEGSVYYNEKENSYCISICQTKINDLYNTNRKDIFDTIKTLGFTPTYDGDKGIKFKNSQLGLYLKTLGKSYEKYIPQEIFNIMNKELAQLFIEVYEKSDGHVDKNGCAKLYTTSKELADQLQMLTFIAGYTSMMHIDDRVGESHFNKKAGNIITHNHKCYVLNISKNKRNSTPVVKRKHISEEYYKGKVYCVNVENHIIFVRRNGICMWSGNCSHQLVRHRIASYSQQSQRYVKEGDNFEFIMPSIIDEMGSLAHNEYSKDMQIIHDIYLKWQKEIQCWVESTNYPTYGMTAEKVANENARYVLPNACETKIVVTMNARSLYNFFTHRLCNRAQEEIRELAELMLVECRKVAPIIFENAGASCERGKCTEGKMNCGHPKKK